MNGNVSEQLRRCAELDAERIRVGIQDAYLNGQGASQQLDADWRDKYFSGLRVQKPKETRKWHRQLTRT